MVERRESNVTPKLRLVGSPVLSRASSTMETFVSAEADSNPKITHTESQESASTGDELPVFERHEESTAIELFYDLFFVANLTTFSNLHEINNVKTLTSYIGFFCILWFTWCLTSLYDIRYVSDSLVARLAKGAHLGVMVGLAVSGPKFDTAEHNSDLKVMGMCHFHQDLILVADSFISTDSDGFEIRPLSAILASIIPCSRIQEHQTSSGFDQRYKFWCRHHLLGNQLVSFFIYFGYGVH
jgi:hypothetical protein